MVLLLLRGLRINLGYATRIFEEPEDVLYDTKLPDDQNFGSVDLQLRLNHKSIRGSSENPEENSSHPYTAIEIATILSIEALQTVHNIISQLQRLSTTIRRASAREYDIRLAKERDIKDGIDEGADDEMCMINLVQNRFKEADPTLC